MPKRSPWERYYNRQREINRKVYDLMRSSKHTCMCGHAQGFHWNTDVGENLGKCVDADCPCEAFDEDVLYHARLNARLARGRNVEHDDTSDDDALSRAMRADEDREVDAEEAWDRALHADRPRPTGKPRPSTLDSPAALDALRELGGDPNDLTG
jgi:hypothetical protein